MNPKVVEILFSKKRQEDNYPSLTFFGDNIQTAISQKYLSLVLDPKLDFDKHINNKILNAIK